jgi:hypothetical protein
MDMTHTLYTLYVPVTDNAERGTIIAEYVARTFARVFGGFTLRHAAGGYFMSDGTLCREPVTLIDGINTGDGVDDIVANLAEYVRVALDQESVLVTRTLVGATFYNGDAS